MPKYDPFEAKGCRACGGPVDECPAYLWRPLSHAADWRLCVECVMLLASHTPTREPMEPAVKNRLEPYLERQRRGNC